MKTVKRAIVSSAAAMAVLGLISSAANAYEFGSTGFAQPPGVDILDNAAPPPPGLYGAVGTQYASKTVVGPGAPKGTNETVTAVGVAPGLNWVTPWTLLGARYSFQVVQPFNYNAIGEPTNLPRQGVHNAYVAPLNLSWALGDSGIFVKTFFSVFVPDGSISGPAGMNSIGVPWWTLQPGAVVSYIKNGWEISLKSAVEFNTPNWDTGYKSGDILHLNFSATRSFGNWSAGPIVTYMGQISNDHSSPFYHGAIAEDRYNDLAVGGVLSYNFGRASAHFWFLKDVIVNASGGSAGSTDPASFSSGFTVFTSLTFAFR